MEIRNTEQLLGYARLFSYQCGTLDRFNEKLKEFGPHTLKKDIVRVKQPNKDKKVTKQDIKVCSLSGLSKHTVI